MMLILWLITVLLSYLIIRDLIKVKPQAFEVDDLDDVIQLLLLVIMPVFNLVAVIMIHRAIIGTSNDDFTKILRKVFLLK